MLWPSEGICPATRGVSSFRTKHLSPFPLLFPVRSSRRLCAGEAPLSSVLVLGPIRRSHPQHFPFLARRTIVCAERVAQPWLLEMAAGGEQGPALCGKAGNSSSLRQGGGEAAVCPGCFRHSIAPSLFWVWGSFPLPPPVTFDVGDGLVSF